MTESGEIVIEEDALFRSIMDYKSASSSSSQDCKIRKVQLSNRPQENTMSTYTPKIISIGPLHHGKPELQPMEDLKHKYLNVLLNRRHLYRNYELSSDGKNDELLGRFIAATRKMEEKVRDYYELSNINTISSDDFVRMLVIDGCFLLEFLLRQQYERKSDDLELQWTRISHDILLFENQIPFFILQAFYKILTEYGVYESSTMVEVAYRYLYFDTWGNHMTFLGADFDNSIEETDSVPSNLLHLYQIKLFGDNQRISKRIIIPKIPIFYCCCNIVFFLKFSWLLYQISKIKFSDRPYVRVPTLISATEIEEAGVRFQGSRMELRFEKGTLTIPVLTLNQESLCLLKNLMVFEFYFRSLVLSYVHTYVFFLSDLIKNPGDLKVMEKHHIISTSGGGDESFALVNELIQAGFEEMMPCEITMMTGHADFNWQSRFSIIYDLKTYCEKPHHRWWAMLMKDYFGNPWSILGLLAGVILLVFAGIQTVFTVLSYYHH